MSKAQRLETKRGCELKFTFEGETITAFEGETLASALLAAGVTAFSLTRTASRDCRFATWAPVSTVPFASMVGSSCALA